MGHSVKRKEDLRFIQGKGTYVEDVHLPGMVYGQMVRSPYAHARIKAVRTEAARNFPGVLAVITGQDLEKAGLSWMPTLFHDKQMVLATGKVLTDSTNSGAISIGNGKIYGSVVTGPSGTVIAGANGSVGDLAALAIVTVPQNANDMTANLMAPLLLDSRTRTGRQTCMDTGRYSTRHHLLPRSE